MRVLLAIVLFSLIFISCGTEENNLKKPNSQELEETRLPNNLLNCLRGGNCGDELKIINKNLTLRKLINFNDMWENYLGHDYSLEEVKELIGGQLNVDWITNSCTIRLSRAMNYSNNKISKWGFNKYAGQYGNPGLILKGGDNLNYAIRVREMAKYLLKFYNARPLHFSKSERVRNLLKGTEHLYDDANLSETEELEKKLRLTGKKGILMFNVALWSDATGHFEVWNGEESKGHSRFLEAQEVFLWVIENNTCESPNMHYDVNSDACICNDGYEEVHVGYCTVVDCPENSHWDSLHKICSCEDGYKMNDEQTECEIVFQNSAMTSIDVNHDYMGNWTEESVNYIYWHVNPNLGGNFNCRAGAGTNNRVLTTLTPSENIDSRREVQYDRNNNPWFKVVTREGIECFVRAKNRYIEPSLFTDHNGNWETETVLYRYWKITNNVSSLNCRAGAGTNNEILTSLASGDYFFSIGKYDYDNNNNIWFKVQTREHIQCFVRAKDRYIEPIK